MVKNKTFTLIKNIVKELQKQYMDKVISYLEQLKYKNVQDKQRTYCLLKEEYKIESYLTMNIPRIYRSKITSRIFGSVTISAVQYVPRYTAEVVTLPNMRSGFL